MTQFDLREKIQSALQNFQTKKKSETLYDASLNLLNILGYDSPRRIRLEHSDLNEFRQKFSQADSLNDRRALTEDWKSIDFLFQLTDNELSGELDLFDNDSVQSGLLKSYLFFAIDLKGNDYSRSKLSDLVRQLNRIFSIPLMVLIRHKQNNEPVLSIGIVNRRRNKKDGDKDVLEKVTLIREISLKDPHRGHLDIITSLALPNLVHPHRIPIKNFDTLHAAWEEILNVELLNKRFYRDLANWYFWALPQVDFPADMEKEDEKRCAIGLIRLLTRLIFCWFIKEKGLIPEKLFIEEEINKILKNLSPDISTYNEAILQNLFFATLNQRMDKDAKGQPYRAFATNEYGDSLYRYKQHFLDPTNALSHFADVPFLNGGLFECLDRTDEVSGKTLFVDGFSEDSKNRSTIPNKLFFSKEDEADLSEAYGDKKRSKEKVRGLFHILNAYKFTVVENTPIDQEIALDPELLGKVFENLLASYNEETKKTARKQTGSFYTPRTIVDYMVDESLKTYLSGVLTKNGMTASNAKCGLDILFAYTEQDHTFKENEVTLLLEAIHTCKILDPACGSGAFPMGMLHKLVFIIQKLDPGNIRWKNLQIAAAEKIPDSSARKAAIEAIERDFSDNGDDYGRKLYLIENCLYGVDIQPIAIQISKLRFFISLVCDQRTNRNKRENHGVRPLPNLETKFIAANALIGLPEIDQLELLPPRVHEIESEIEELYHRYFSVQRRDQKIALQKKFKSLREELGRVHAESLGTSQKAQYIVEWSPFDSQIKADFFDPKLMFGQSLAIGFDIVFGNPPWGAELSKVEKEQFKKLYPEIDSSTPNSFAYFIGAALNHAKSQVAFVLPDAFLIKDYAKTRQLLRAKVTKIDWYQNTGIPEQLRPFVYVEHDVCVVFLDKEKYSDRCMTTKHQYNAGLASLTIEQNVLNKDTFILSQHDYCFNLLITHETFKLMKQLEKGSQLGIITQCHEGIHTGNSREKLFHKGNISKHCRPLFYGGRAGDQIENYYSTTSGWFVDYRTSIIDKTMGDYASLRDERIFKYPKIYVTRTGNPIKAFFDRETYASNNFFSLQFRDYKDNTEKNLKSLLPLILSSISNYYIRNFAAPRLGNTYVETKIIHLNRIPVADEIFQHSGLFEIITNCIINSIKLKKKSHTQFLEELVDACVMECYFRDHMEERDLLFIDEITSYLTKNITEKSGIIKSDTINNLFEKLNTPSSKIHNRLLRISTDSPDLLAVIKKSGTL